MPTISQLSIQDCQIKQYIQYILDFIVDQINSKRYWSIYLKIFSILKWQHYLVREYILL